MKVMKKILARSYLVIFTVLMLSQAAFAYLDPGTVTYVISMIAALFIAGGTALAIFRRKIKLFFQNLGKKKETTSASTVVEDEDDVVNPMEVNPMDEQD